MKRLLKFFLNLFLALIAVALSLVVVFFLTPPWQKSAVEELLARDSARKWQVGKVKILPAMMEAEEVFMLDGSVGAEVKYLHLEGDFWKLPFTRVIEVRSGTVAGLDLDVSQVAVGDPTSVDYQAFLRRVSSDEAFWKERIGVVLGKLAATGLRIQVADLDISGVVHMPGGKEVPVRWTILEADSSAPRLIRIQPQMKQSREL